jgi:hypothetical protein
VRVVQGLMPSRSHRVFPYAGIQFMTFDAVKLNILRLKGTPNGQLSNLESLCAGSFAGGSPTPMQRPPVMTSC